MTVGGHGARGGEWGREAARGEARDVDGVHGDAGVEQTAETLDWLVSQVARGARDGARDLAVGQTDAETRAKTVSRGFNRHGLIFVDEGSHALHDGLVEQILSVARGDDGAFGHGGDAARKLEERGGVAAVHGRRREDALKGAFLSRDDFLVVFVVAVFAIAVVSARARRGCAERLIATRRAFVARRRFRFAASPFRPR